jgi:hypothetical protein
LSSARQYVKQWATDGCKSSALKLNTRLLSRPLLRTNGVPSGVTAVITSRGFASRRAAEARLLPFFFFEWLLEARRPSQRTTTN